MTYRVKDWGLIYETHETRKLRRLTFVAVPNKHDGKGYRRMASKGPVMAERLFAAWNGIIQLASRMPVRGVLADRDGDLSPEAMADRTSLRPETYRLALTFFSSEESGWLEKSDENGIYPDISRNLPELREVSGKTGAELKGIEGNRTEENTPLPPKGGLEGLKLAFEEARKAYPGTKRGLETEWTDFRKRNGKTLADTVPLLLPGIEREKKHHAALARVAEQYPGKVFIPSWKNFKTWINQRCWEQEFPKEVTINA